MKKPRACLFGGTGFVGHALLHRLRHAGFQCRVPTRYPHRHRELKLYPEVELVTVPRQLDAATLADCVRGCELVVNLIGILNETPRTRFQTLHVDLVERIVAAAQAAGVSRYWHLSALGAEDSSEHSQYQRTKAAGEAVALNAAGLGALCLRPSVIFGQGDHLFTRFARLLDLTPGLFPLACAETRFAPVWVGDVAEAMVRALDDPNHLGTRLDLCGPQVMTLHEIVAYTANCRGRWVKIIPLNEKAGQWQARLLGYLPGQPFSLDTYRALQFDSLCTGHNGLLELGIHPTAVEAQVPLYLATL